MKNKSIYLLLLITFYLSKITISQNPLIVTGEHQFPKGADKEEGHPEQKLNQYNGCELLGTNSSFIFISDRNKAGRIITTYDIKTLKKVTSFYLPSFRRVVIDEVKMTYFPIVSEGDYKEQRVSSVDFNGKIIDKEKSLFTVHFKSKKHKKKSYFSSYISANKSKYLFTNTTWYVNDELEIWLYDNTFNQLIHKNIKLPYSSDKLDICDLLVSNNGEVVIIASFKEAIGRSLKVFAISEKTAEFQEIKIDQQGRYFDAYWHYPDRNIRGLINDSLNKLILTGLCFEKKNELAVCYVSIDLQSIVIEISKFNKISENLLKEALLSYRKILINEFHDASNILIRNFFSDNKGGLKVICEVIYRGGIDDKTTFRNKIIEFDIDKSGILSRTSIIPKFQRDSYQAIGFIPFQLKNRTYFIFNDHYLNISKYNEDPFQYEYYESSIRLSSEYKNAVLVNTYYSISEDKLIKKSVFENQEFNIVIFPEHYLRIDDNTILTWYNQKEIGIFPFAKITFVAKD